MTYLLYAVFAVILLLSYMSIRRQWLKPAVTATLCVALASLTLTLMGLSQGNMAIQAIITGVLIGIVFSALTLGTAVYFQATEGRNKDYRDAQAPVSTDQDLI